MADSTIYVLDADGGKAVITGDDATLKVIRKSLEEEATQIEVYDYGYFAE